MCKAVGEGQKKIFEVFAEGSALAWRLDFVSLQPAELGLLLTGLGQGEPPLRLKLGGYKPACFGSVECRVGSLTLDEPTARWLAYAPAADAPAPDAAAHDGPDLAAYLAAATDSGLVLRERLERLAGILRYPSGRDCPGEGY